MGYIPTLSLFKELSNNQLVDMEWAYRFNRTYSGDSLFNNNESHHRYWVRYSSEKLEARLGLQKIVFGPSFVLRSLSWFDTIDLKDPTGQTDGVEAFRLRWFPSNSLSIWSWSILNDQDSLSFGGRAEVSINMGDLGFTYHQDPSKGRQDVQRGNRPRRGRERGDRAPTAQTAGPGRVHTGGGAAGPGQDGLRVASAHRSPGRTRQS